MKKHKQFGPGFLTIKIYELNLNISMELFGHLKKKIRSSKFPTQALLEGCLYVD